MKKSQETQSTKPKERKKKLSSAVNEFEPKDQSRWVALILLFLFLLMGYFFWVQ